MRLAERNKRLFFPRQVWGIDAERKAGKTRGPLHGIPVLIKDNIDTADKMKTTAGSRALVDAPTPKQDAFIVKQLRDAGFRVESNTISDKIGAKIRHAQMQKIPYMLVLGDKELEDGTVAVRHRKEGDIGVMSLNEFVEKISQEKTNRSH